MNKTCKVCAGSKEGGALQRMELLETRVLGAGAKSEGHTGASL